MVHYTTGIVGAPWGMTWEAWVISQRVMISMGSSELVLNFGRRLLSSLMPYASLPTTCSRCRSPSCPFHPYCPHCRMHSCQGAPSSAGCLSSSCSPSFPSSLWSRCFAVSLARSVSFRMMPLDPVLPFQLRGRRGLANSLQSLALGRLWGGAVEV